MLAVGEVGYTSGELGALSIQQREQLGVLTAFGLAVAQGRVMQAARPFVSHEQQTLLLQKLATEVSLQAAGKDETTLRRAYAAEPEYELVVRHIVFLSERWRPAAHRQKARSRAEAALARAQSGENFAALAAELSEEPGATQRGGLLRPGREGSWVPEFWEAASSLEEGDLSNVVETQYGYHVIRLEERHVIPFEEVRDRVLGRLVDLTAAAGEARAWADRQAATLTVDVATMAAWRSGTAQDSVVLAHWPAGVYRGAEFRTYLLTLERGARTRLEAATPMAYERVVAGAARNALLMDRAADMGIRLSSAEKQATARRWHEQVQRWAVALGFRRGQSVSEVKSTALEALGADQQNMLIARDEVLNIGPALEMLYPIKVTTATSTGGRP